MSETVILFSQTLSVYYITTLKSSIMSEIITLDPVLVLHKGAFIYYVITLGGVGGPDTNDDIDDALRGDGGGG